MLPTQESPKLVTLTRDPFAEAKDGRETGGVGRRRHHAPRSCIRQAPRDASFTGAPRSLATKAANEPNEDGGKLYIL